MRSDLEGRCTYFSFPPCYNDGVEGKITALESRDEGRSRVPPPRQYNEEGQRVKKERIKYTHDLPRRMYSYFASYSGGGAPSFQRFAIGIGLTLADVSRFREKKEFERAYKECSEIRRDYLINMALEKKNDSSFTKFLLATEYGMGEDDAVTDNRLEVTVEVRDD